MRKASTTNITAPARITPMNITDLHPPRRTAEDVTGLQVLEHLTRNGRGTRKRWRPRQARWPRRHRPEHPVRRGSAR
ncbi:MAG: hypothetical protein MZV64_71830 [Ignavibacteriales bacterium]|nr:hypothetical protein [Ignavibacteriales bacterium]